MQLDQTRDLLRVLDRVAVEQMAWLMRVHAALMFGEGELEPPPALPDCPSLAAMARMRGVMCRKAQVLKEHGQTDRAAYRQFMLAVEAYSREARRIEAQLRRQLAETDPLTGVHNRQGMLRDIRREWTRALRTGSQTCVAIADLDFFKQVNDTYGHAAGDTVLCLAARFFVRRLRPYDLVFRYGGEEFLFCLPDTDAETARKVLDRLRTLMARLPVALECGSRIKVSCSIGVAQMVPGRTVHEAIAAADRALYSAKDAGRNRVVLAPPPHPDMPAVPLREATIRGAVRH